MNVQNDTAKNQPENRGLNFVLWVRDLMEAARLIERGLDVRHFTEINEYCEQNNQHYIIADREYGLKKGTPEATIKAIALKLQALGQEVRVHVINQSLWELLGDGAIAAREFVAQVLDAPTFDQWCNWLNNQPLSIDEAVDVAQVAIALIPQSNKELANLRKRCGVTLGEWQAIVSDLKSDTKEKQESNEDERLRLALLDLAQETNSIARTRKRSQICKHYRLSKQEVETLIGEMQAKTTQGSLKRMSLDDLLALESEQLDWLIPELLPRGEMVILGGSPKAGKTLMAVDAAFAIATGEADFLGIKCDLGKVLLITNDESEQSTKTKLLKRGFRTGDGQRFEIINNWSIERLYELELILDEFRPDVVILDSLKSITTNSKISENSAEFANNIYALKNLLSQYKCAGILIHHTNKNPNAMGVGKLRGSSAIAGAVWGSWQLDHIPKPDPNGGKRFIIDPEDPTRLLSVYARDIGGQTIKLELDPETNSYSRLDSDIIDQQAKIRDRITSVLKLNPQGLRGRDIMERLEISKEQSHPVYAELNRMEANRLISIVTDRRTILYTLKDSTHLDQNSDRDFGTEGVTNFSEPTTESDNIPAIETSVGTSLLDIENSGGNPEVFIGDEVEVRSLVTDKLKCRGEMIGYDYLNGSVTVITQDGTTRYEHVREVFVTVNKLGDLRSQAMKSA